MLEVFLSLVVVWFSDVGEQWGSMLEFVDGEYDNGVVGNAMLLVVRCSSDVVILVVVVVEDFVDDVLILVTNELLATDDEVVLDGEVVLDDEVLLLDVLCVHVDCVADGLFVSTLFCTNS
jgi:hypothetical protein